VALDEQILQEAKAAREALLEVERQQEHAKVDYHHAIRRLHAAGGSLREIAEALGLSHQRVHQIVGEQAAGPPFMTPVATHPELQRILRVGRGKRRTVQFDVAARGEILRAQDEARALGHNYVGTEHVLLALVASTEGLAVKLGLTYEGVLAQVLTIVGRGEEAPAGEMRFTPRTKKVLELALRQALKTGSGVTSDQILLAIAREGEGVAAQILLNVGIDTGTIERALEDAA
jgi:ATP-dependent Clp protease ATP-binding subunit ClpA